MSRTLKTLQNALGNCEGIADILDDLHDAISTKSDFAPSAALREMILDFSTMVNQMNEEVQLSRTKGVHRLMWPFSKDENERLLNRISRYKDTFNLTLNLQNASAFPLRNGLTFVV